jgi:hypothetical protein
LTDQVTGRYLLFELTCHVQVRELEQKAVLLETQNTALAEELKSYQTYMRDTITQYKKQINSLTAQLKDQNVAPARVEDDGSRLHAINQGNCWSKLSLC